MRWMVLLFFCFGLQSATAQPAACPFTNFEKALVEDAINKFALDAIFSSGSGVFPGGFPTKVHFAYSSTLLGQVRAASGKFDPGIREHASLTELCTAPKTFQRTCRSESGVPSEERFWETHDVCVEISCQAKGIYQAEIEWISFPDEEPAFRYDATKKQEIIYNPSPSVTWRLDDTAPRRIIVTGDLISFARVKQDGSKTIRVNYSGNVTAVTTDEGLSSLVLQMTFPALGGLIPARAELFLHRHDDPSANGTIAVGERTLANLTLRPGEPVEIAWIAECP